ncbi:MAG: tRNA epoxyqueuosine(34) reductase QueG [Acidobacteriia bacterium]|nr:tRNA epoxyqueuosine(34) reductase QueG [Terriglobia bacterium]
MTIELIQRLAHECGFELAGAAPAVPLGEAGYYRHWVAAGFAGEMKYLTDHRAEVRDDPGKLLPSARSVICVGKLYNGPEPYSTQLHDRELAWISRYAWGEDYHDVLRCGLARLVEKIREHSAGPFDWKICVDTAPLLERAYARRAGLGWIGKNTCLINQDMGSWFFLGELMVSLAIEPGAPPPDRCGTCTQCIDACPTAAIVPAGVPGGPEWAIDSRLCIAYFTIELHGSVPAEARAQMGNHVFGCDICQDVCPWNHSAPVTSELAFSPQHFAPDLARLAQISEEEFRAIFRSSPVKRARYAGFLRNVAVAMGNQRSGRFRQPLESLARSPYALVAEHARWALAQLAPR